MPAPLPAQTPAPTPITGGLPDPTARPPPAAPVLDAGASSTTLAAHAPPAATATNATPGDASNQAPGISRREEAAPDATRPSSPHASAAPRSDNNQTTLPAGPEVAVSASGNNSSSSTGMIAGIGAGIAAAAAVLVALAAFALRRRRQQVSNAREAAASSDPQPAQVKSTVGSAGSTRIGGVTGASSSIRIGEVCTDE